MAIYTADITVHNGTSVVTLKCATEGFDDYDVNIIAPGVMKMMMFSNNKTMGASELGRGAIVFSNTDGSLDDWLNWGFGGRSIVLKKWIAGVAILTMSCTMEQPVPSDNEMTMRLKDVQVKLTVPLQANKYAGNNTLPNGLEGVADIKGKPKPLLYGKVFNATPVLVNTSKLIYQGNDGAVQDISAVYDKGVSLVRGTDYTNQADMEANQPTEGQYRVWLAGGYFRLGSSPAGQVTCDGIEGANAAARTDAQIAKRIALRVLDSGELIAQDFTDLDTLNSAEIGIYINQEIAVNEVLDEVLGSIGAWYGFDSDAKFNVGRLDTPSGTPIKTLDQYDISSIELLPTEDEGRGLPVWKVNLNYWKNYTVQDAGGLAGQLTTPEWIDSTLPSTGTWAGITFGNGLFIAVKYNSAICATSPDGITWTQQTMPVTANWYSITYGNCLFVALGYGSNIAATSTDGITWIQRTLLSSANWASVVFGNELFVAVANGGGVITSPDCITWTNRTTPSINPQAATFGNGLFVVVGFNTNVIITSPDGITWTQRTISSTTTWNKVTYGNGMFVAVGNVGSISTSPDGITWTSRIAPEIYNWFNVTYGNGLFIASAFYGYTAYITSPDGITWTLRNLPITTTWAAMTYGNNGFVITSQTGSISSIYNMSAPSALAQFFSKEYRTVSSPDASIKTIHPLATEINLNSLLVEEADAQDEADRQLALRKVRRDYVAVRLSKSAMNDLSVFPSIGKLIKLEYPRYGYDAGKLFVLIGYEVYNQTEDLILYLWG